MTIKIMRIISSILAGIMLTIGLNAAPAFADNKVTIESMTVMRSGIEVRPYTDSPTISKEEKEREYRNYKNLTRVVMIEKYVFSKDGTKKKIGTGAGFMLPNGYIMTNNHVAPESYNGLELRFHITFYAQRYGGYLIGTLVATDVKEDLSILKIDNDWIPQEYQDSYYKDFNLQPAPNEQVTVIGHPTKPLESPYSIKVNGEIMYSISTMMHTWTPLYGTFTADNVAIIRHTNDGSIPDIATNAMEFHVETWPGNSGGPVIDSNDQLVGIMSCSILGEPRSFATSSKLLLRFIEKNNLSEAIFGPENQLVHP